RKRLLDKDTLLVGSTEIAFRAPDRPTPLTATPTMAAAPELTPAQRRVLVALCRPFASDESFPRPASNAAIAEELTLSVAAVKTHLRTLFALLSVEELPQNEKRSRLVERAFELGLVSPRELQ